VVLEFLEPNDYPGPGTGEVRVTIEEGDTGAAIAKRLVEQDVVKSTKAYIEAANANARSSGIQPGVYALKKQMSAADAVAVLVDANNRITNAVVIREGLWAKEIYAILSKTTGIPVADYVKAAKDAKALGLPPRPRATSRGTSSLRATPSTRSPRRRTSSSRWWPAPSHGSRSSASTPSAWNTSSSSRASSRLRHDSTPTARRSHASWRTVS
jgi:hypothetical protein